MRTLPANFTTGLTNHYRIVWLVKLIGDSATYYWLTNKRGNTATSDVTLTDNSATKSYDSSLLAKSINGSDEVAIGEIEQNIDISGGGAVGSCCDVDLILLNQLRFDTTLESFGLENRTVSIYCGFIPDGTIPTLELTDMIPIWTGVFDSHEEDYGQETIHLVDSRDLRHKSIPQTIINNTSTSGVAANFPNAPDESVGQVLPILYGDFYTPNTVSNAIYFEIYDMAPAICTDALNGIFTMCWHKVKLAASAFYSDGSMKAPALISLSDQDGNLSDPNYNVDPATISLSGGTMVGKVTQIFSRAGGACNVTDFVNAIDGNPVTYASVPNTTFAMLQLVADNVPSGTPLIIGKWSGVILFAIVGTIVSSSSFQIGRISVPGGTYDYTSMVLGGGLYTYITLLSYNNLDDILKSVFFIQDNPSYTPAPETLKVYTMGLQYAYIISDQFYYGSLKYRVRLL